MLLMLKFLKYWKYIAIHCRYVVWIAIYFKYFKNINISNITKEVNKEIPEDDLIGDRNMLDYFLKMF